MANHPHQNRAWWKFYFAEVTKWPRARPGCLQEQPELCHLPIMLFSRAFRLPFCTDKIVSEPCQDAAVRNLVFATPGTGPRGAGQLAPRSQQGQRPPHAGREVQQAPRKRNKKPGSRQQPQHNSCRASRLRPMLSTSSSCHDVLLSELIPLLLTAPSRPLPKHAVGCMPGTAAQPRPPAAPRVSLRPSGIKKQKARMVLSRSSQSCRPAAHRVGSSPRHTRGTAEPELLHPGCKSFLP